MEIPVQPANHFGKLALLLKYPCWEKREEKMEERRKWGRIEGREEEKRRKRRGRQDGGEHRSTLLEPLSQKNINIPLSHMGFLSKNFQVFQMDSR